MTSQTESARKLRDQALELLRALEGDDPEKIQSAFESRQTAFDRLTAELETGLHPSAGPLVAEVLAADRNSEEAATRALAKVRLELDRIRRAREVMRLTRPEKPEPRFVSRRA